MRQEGLLSYEVGAKGSYLDHQLTVKVFDAAGITQLPTTWTEFLADAVLQAVNFLPGLSSDGWLGII